MLIKYIMVMIPPAKHFADPPLIGSKSALYTKPFVFVLLTLLEIKRMAARTVIELTKARTRVLSVLSPKLS